MEWSWYSPLPSKVHAKILYALIKLLWYVENKEGKDFKLSIQTTMLGIKEMP